MLKHVLWVIYWAKNGKVVTDAVYWWQLMGNINIFHLFYSVPQ